MAPVEETAPPPLVPPPGRSVDEEEEEEAPEFVEKVINADALLGGVDSKMTPALSLLPSLTSGDRRPCLTP